MRSKGILMGYKLPVRFTAVELPAHLRPVTMFKVGDWAVFDNSRRVYVETDLSQKAAIAFADAKNLDLYELYDAKKYNAQD